MESVKNYQVPLIESNMDLLKKMTGEDVAKAALEKAVSNTLIRIPRMQAALEAAKDYISMKVMGSAGVDGDAVIKQIDEALKEEKNGT